MGKVVERRRHHLIAARLIHVAVGVVGAYGEMTVAAFRLIIEEVVHDEIAVALAHEAEGHGLAIFVVVARGKGILPPAAYAEHGVLNAVFYDRDVPS